MKRPQRAHVFQAAVATIVRLKPRLHRSVGIIVEIAPLPYCKSLP